MSRNSGNNESLGDSRKKILGDDAINRGHEISTTTPNQSSVFRRRNHDPQGSERNQGDDFINTQPGIYSR